jgi:hypothetical protein
MAAVRSLGHTIGYKTGNHFYDVDTRTPPPPRSHSQGMPPGKDTSSRRSVRSSPRGSTAQAMKN